MKSLSLKLLMCALPFSSFFSAASFAQDSRQVIEPRMPAVCTVLTATQATKEVAESTIVDTQKIQAALDQCPQGQAVQLAANNERDSFIAGPLRIPSGVSLRIDRGVTLYASTDPSLFERGDKFGACGVNAEKGRQCLPFIRIEDAKFSGLYGPDTIDGQGGALVRGKTESWWQMARRAQRENNEHNVPRLIEVNRSQDITFYQLRLHNSPNFHVTLNRVDGFTAWAVVIDTPSTSRNTDGIDPISSRNITVAHSYIRTGDDNIAIKGGNNGMVENVSILNNQFYTGHGMSIGSETNGGVRNVLVRNLSMQGTTSGLRIKSDVSRGGVVEHIRYENVCLRDIKRPLDIDTRYGRNATGQLIPRYRDIVMENVHSLSPGQIILRGYEAQNPLRLQMKQVSVAAASLATQTVAFAEINVDGTPQSFIEEGKRIELPTVSGSTCAGKFADFPVVQKKDVRPQLTAQQAALFSIEEVLKRVGEAGKEKLDPWNPLNDDLVRSQEVKADYVVDRRLKTDGIRVFHSVQAAVNQALLDGRKLQAKTAANNRLWIELAPDTYRELLYVPVTAVPITLFSKNADARQTKIVANLHAALLGRAYVSRFAKQFEGVDPSIVEMFDSIKDRPVIGTNGSAVAWIRGDGFQVKNITIENAYNKEAIDTSTECPNSSCGATAGTAPVVVVHHQAVAMMVEGADKVQFENLRLLGLQDTLYLRSTKPGLSVRSFFHRSYVEGNVDFIFGDTTAYFYRSEIKSIGDRSTSYVAAPNTNLRSAYGFVFNECDFTHDGSANALAGKFYLARQWFHTQKCTPYAGINVPGYRCELADVDGYQAPVGTISKQVLETVGKVVILNSRIGAHIQTQHPWADWNKKGSLAFRPAQYAVADYFANLAEVSKERDADWVQQLGYSLPLSMPTPAAAIFLAEFNNSVEAALTTSPAHPSK